MSAPQYVHVTWLTVLAVSRFLDAIQDDGYHYKAFGSISHVICRTAFFQMFLPFGGIHKAAPALCPQDFFGPNPTGIP